MSKYLFVVVMFAVMVVLSACGGEPGKNDFSAANPITAGRAIEKSALNAVTQQASPAASPETTSALQGQSKDESGKACLTSLLVVVQGKDAQGVNRSHSFCKSAEEHSTCDKLNGGVWTLNKAQNAAVCLPK